MKTILLFTLAFFCTSAFASNCSKLLNQYGKLTKGLRDSKNLAAFAQDAESYQELIEEIQEYEAVEEFSDEIGQNLKKKFWEIREKHQQNQSKARSETKKILAGYNKVSDCIEDTYSAENDKMEEYLNRFYSSVMDDCNKALEGYLQSSKLLDEYFAKLSHFKLKAKQLPAQNCDMPGFCSSSINDSRLLEKEDLHQKQPVIHQYSGAKNV